MDITTYSSYFLLAGRVLIGFYFFFFVFWNGYHWRPTLDAMRLRKIPSTLAFPVMIFGLFLEGVTGLMIMFGIYTGYAALLLILFDIVASFIFHPFWIMEWGVVRTLNTIIFIGNLTMTLGGLLLLVGISAMI
ncbi:hypothetical protein [Legionella yabuuchiae]|uniref:hypothetical protein n=1 Tax=Legionella yabuuchiae TaxID=376727 RepID=UPI0010561119|nr:hypothetical protein [Legionella yabuuchiae]